MCCSGVFKKRNCQHTAKSEADTSLELHLKDDLQKLKSAKSPPRREFLLQWFISDKTQLSVFHMEQKLNSPELLSSPELCPAEQGPRSLCGHSALGSPAEHRALPQVLHSDPSTAPAPSWAQLIQQRSTGNVPHLNFPLPFLRISSRGQEKAAASTSARTRETPQRSSCWSTDYSICMGKRL